MRLKWSKECPTPPNWVPSFYRHSSFAYSRNIVQFIRLCDSVHMIMCLCGTDSTNQAYKGALTCCAVVNCVVYSHWVSRVIYTVHSYTNATQKYLNSSLFQIHEMCLNKLIIIKIFCRHNNLIPVEARSTFASTSFFLFLSVFLYFLSEQHVFISTCHS